MPRYIDSMEGKNVNLFTVLMFAGMACVPDLKTICGAKFVDAYDGDTFNIDLPGQGHPVFTVNIPVRMLGIDAPEMDSKDPCELKKALEAKTFTKNILSGAKRIDLHFVQRDKYFRILAVPVVDGLSVPQQLADAKLAVGYDGATKPKVDWCSIPPKLQGEIK